VCVCCVLCDARVCVVSLCVRESSCAGVVRVMSGHADIVCVCVCCERVL